MMSGKFTLGELNTERLFKSLYATPEYRIIVDSVVSTNYCPTNKVSPLDLILRCTQICIIPLVFTVGSSKGSSLDPVGHVRSSSEGT